MTLRSVPAEERGERPDRLYELPPIDTRDLMAQRSRWQHLWGLPAVRKALILVGLVLLWEGAARYQGNPLMLPGASATVRALWDGLFAGPLLARIGVSLSVLIKGYALGSLLALGLTTLAVSTRIGRDLLTTLTSMFSPLPAIALLPLALLWFGLGEASLIFVLIHSVLWAMAVNIHAGFQGVSETLRMAGRNYGLRGLRYVALILIPAALPSLLAGLRIGWAFAWRTLIAAELVFGASSGGGGLGWYIFQNRNELYTDKVFAGLVVVIVIGLLVENLIFDTFERLTVRRWGMVRGQ
ncbi:MULTISPECIES: ABC transporter permease [Modicisalibacter]|uniref:ABC transporter permease subunit n=1 Tax=Modicisalibacter tunisiensis TaxID=390637 RepID=A0ABS7WVM1_9GAMM|nr:MULTISPECIES: ABC transporter permease subunit [Modicisalibacter]MBZ9540347.1 ABC transporter permease subunit [Modicisalibacter tunisiensis]MBZ9566219.1 ABC transporter permease subunit [Modicisalibacter tunisiensis]